MSSPFRGKSWTSVIVLGCRHLRFSCRPNHRQLEFEINRSLVDSHLRQGLHIPATTTSFVLVIGIKAPILEPASCFLRIPVAGSSDSHNHPVSERGNTQVYLVTFAVLDDVGEGFPDHQHNVAFFVGFQINSKIVDNPDYFVPNSPQFRQINFPHHFMSLQDRNPSV